MSATAWRRWQKTLITDGNDAATVAEHLLNVGGLSVDDDASGLYCRFDEAARMLRCGIVLGDASTRTTRELAVVLLACLRATATRKISPHLWSDGLEPAVDATCDWPSWFTAWLGELASADTPEKRLAWLEPALRRALLKRISLGALTATPQTPFIFDLHYFTDGCLVLPQGEAYHALRAGQPYAHWALADADPRSFRRLAGDPFHGAAFYADCRQVWFSSFFSTHHLFAHGGAVLKGMREDPDSPCFLLCGDTLWSPVESLVAPEAAALSQLRSKIAAAGGMVLDEARSDGSSRIVDWLQPLYVDAASFKYIGSNLFHDGRHLYAHFRHGTEVIGPATGKVRRIGEFVTTGQAVYLFGRELVGADAGSFEALAFPFARDGRYVWYRDCVLPDCDPADPQLPQRLARLRAEQGLY